MPSGHCIQLVFLPKDEFADPLQHVAMTLGHFMASLWHLRVCHRRRRLQLISSARLAAMRIHNTWTALSMNLRLQFEHDHNTRPHAMPQQSLMWMIT